MTKYISIFLLLIFSGCKEKVKYPRIVKNGCGLYAVQVDSTDGVLYYLDSGSYWNIKHQITSSFYTYKNPHFTDLITNVFGANRRAVCDSLEKIKCYWKCNCPNESQFNDSSDAIKAINEFLRLHHYQDSVIESINAQEKTYSDSVEKCHTYN